MTKIEWTERTWNPVVGCARVSEGCRHCYAERMSARLANMADADAVRQAADLPADAVPDVGRKGEYRHVVRWSEQNEPGSIALPQWNGQVRCIDEALDEPLRRKKPTTWFVCSMSDLFHESVPFEFIDGVWAVMALCPQHTFQVLTKRPERMAEYLAEHRELDMADLYARLAQDVDLPDGFDYSSPRYDPITDPLANVWLGTSVEDQAAADARIPHLLRCPAAVRFLSCEPLLGEVDLRLRNIACYWHQRNNFGEPLHWVIVGGESGPGARHMDPDWARSLRDQCEAEGVAFFMKQMDKKQPIPPDLMVRQFPGEESTRQPTNESTEPRA